MQVPGTLYKGNCHTNGVCKCLAPLGLKGLLVVPQYLLCKGFCLTFYNGLSPHIGHEVYKDVDVVGNPDYFNDIPGVFYTSAALRFS
jgi:hypothetical protein